MPKTPKQVSAELKVRLTPRNSKLVRIGAAKAETTPPALVNEIVGDHFMQKSAR